MKIFLRKIFLQLYFITFCIAVQYECDNSTEIPVSYQCNRANVTCGCGYSDVETNPSCIMIGENAVEASWSMFVSLRNLNSTEHICGGTLLSNLYVLTAAHCVEPFLSSTDLSNLTIIAGITDLSDSVQHVRNIHRIYMHPNFTDQDHKFVNDIALLELDYRLLVDSNPLLSRTCITPTNSSILINQYSVNDSRLIVIGWETVQYDILQQTEVFTNDYDELTCSNLIKDVDTQFCAKTYQTRKGDSGESVFQWTGEYWEQVGIISYEDGLAANSSLKIYTGLSPYVDWINEMIIDTSPDQTSTSTQTSTTSNSNFALKHEPHIILSNMFIFIILILFVGTDAYFLC